MKPDVPVQAGVQTDGELLAVIDLGTNTFNLVIVRLNEFDTFHVVEKIKEAVRLGEGGVNQDLIAPAAFARGLQALRNFRQVIDARGVRHIVACATSAIRSAANGSDFVQAVREETGIEIRTITGGDEAWLIYQGVRHGINLPFDETVLMMDIGGGSVAFVAAMRSQVKLMRSLNIGVQRVFERFQPSDPITPADIQAIQQFYREALAPILPELQQLNIRTLIGSSGTFETLASLSARHENRKLESALLNGYQIELGTYRHVFEWLMRSRLDERLTIPGILPMRAELVVVGALLVQTLIEDLNLERLLLSMYSLKEGMIFDYIEELRNHLPDQRERTVREDAVRILLKKFYHHDTHPDQVSRLALMIFDQTKYLHNYGPWERELLHYSALLHDIGQYIHRSGHHKHGQYIIQNANLPGFNSDEIVLLSNLVRYHRKSLPSREHFNYNMLYKEHKLIVNKLAGILRIADNLDRTHQSVVRTVDLKFEPNTIVFVVHTRKPAPIEIEHAQQNAEFFCSAFATSVRFEQRLEM